MPSAGWRHGADDPPSPPPISPRVASGRLGGLDVGTKTIGLATCDATWSFATPAETIQRTKFTADLAAAQGVHRAPRLAGLVVGLPLNLDGSDQPAHAVGPRLRPQPRCRSGFQLLLWDERWSTVAVERTMIEADMSRAKRAEKIDAHAAAHILQAAIDALVNLPRPG